MRYEFKGDVFIIMTTYVCVKPPQFSRTIESLPINAVCRLAPQAPQLQVHQYMYHIF